MKKKHYLLIGICVATIGMAMAITIYFRESRLITIGKYSACNEMSICISNDERDKYLKSELSEYVVPTERTEVKDSFMVVIDYTTYVDGTSVNTKQDQGGIIGSGFFGLEFEQRLIGAEVESNVFFEIEYPSDYEDVVLAGKTFGFDVYIKRIVEFVYPNLTDEFVITYLEYDSIDSFYSKIENELRELKMQEQKKTNIKSSFDQLVRDSKFFIRESDILSRFEDLVDFYAENASYQGLDVYTYAYQVLGMDKEDFISYCKEESEYYIKSVLVAQYVAKKFDIHITEETISSYCDANQIYYLGEEPSEYLFNLILIDEVMNHLYSKQ